MNINHLIDTYGYWAVFLLGGAESLGVPVPGETALIVAGTYAGHTHRLNPWIIFASHTIDLIIVGVAVFAVTGVIFLVRRQIAKLGLQAEAAYPGPLSQ